MSCKPFSFVLKSLFIQHRTFASSITSNKAWTFEESKKLEDLIKLHGNKWAFLRQHFKDRSKKSLEYRCRFLKQKPLNEIDISATTSSQPRSYDTWTKKEDTLLLSLTMEHGMQWTKISSHFPNRTVSSLCQRHKRLSVEETTIRRGQWSRKENANLQALFNLYGDDFKMISSVLRSRTAEQCRSRVKYITTSPVSVKSLSETQLDSLKRAAETYGTDDFKLLIKKSDLPSFLDPKDVCEYYWKELDPAIETSDWTKDQVISMVHIFNELDGCMELVQKRLPVKRSLKDMWVRYNDYILYG